MSASVQTTIRPRAASVPIRRAVPEPEFRAARTTRTSERSPARSADPSSLPSSTTINSHLWFDAAIPAVIRSSSSVRWPASLCTGSTIETSSVGGAGVTA